MKIVFLEAASLGSDVDLSGFRRYGEVTTYQNTSEDECLERVEGAEVVFCNKLRMSARTLGDARTLKLICVTATGTNNIDAAFVRKHGIAVTNVAGYATNSVAQHTFAMYFYLAEHLRFYDDFVRDGSYAKSSLFACLDAPFCELHGKTWGVIGLGTIGRRVAEIAKAFGCRVIYYSTTGCHDDSEYRRVSFEGLLEESDVISIHAPLTPRTENLMTLEAFVNMKREAILLNLGRGSIVNERDLCCALNEGLIAAAGIDVLTAEPIRPDNPLLAVRDRSRLYITPHIAWASIEARSGMVRDLMRNLDSYLEGGDRNRVY